MATLSQHEFELARPVPVYATWVNDQFKDLVKTDEGKSDLRLGRGLAKQLKEEAFPLSRFASHYFDNSENVFIKHILGNQPYDAQIDDKRCNQASFQFVEVTLAHEGEDEYYRMLALERDGVVSPIGPVERTPHGPQVRDVGKSETVLLHEEIHRIKAAVANKASKAEYPQGTALVIGFDDRMVLHTDQDRDELLRGIQGVLDSVSHFALIGCIGLLRGTYIDLRRGQ